MASSSSCTQWAMRVDKNTATYSTLEEARENCKHPVECVFKAGHTTPVYVCGATGEEPRQYIHNAFRTSHFTQVLE